MVSSFFVCGVCGLVVGTPRQFVWAIIPSRQVEVKYGRISAPCANAGEVCVALVTLMELLRIYAELFVQRTYHISLSIDRLSGPGSVSIWNDAEHRTNLRLVLEELGDVCAKSELPVTKLKIKYLLICFQNAEDPNHPQVQILRNNLPNHMIAHSLHEIRDRLIDELSTKIF